MYFAARMDANQINQGSFIYEHETRVMQRLVFIAVLSLPCSFEGSWSGVLETFLMFVTLCGVFASIFSPVLNVMLEKPIFYLGETAEWDKWWRNRGDLYPVFVVTNLIFWLFVYFYYLY